MNDELYELWSLNEGWQICKIVEPVISTGIDTGSLDTKLFLVWIHRKQNKIHYIILLVIVAEVITSLREKI